MIYWKQAVGFVEQCPERRDKFINSVEDVVDFYRNDTAEKKMFLRQLNTYYNSCPKGKYDTRIIDNY